LDVSGNTALRILDCSLNQLSALDVSENMVLTTLDCRYNQLSAGALNVLFGTLQGNTGWPRSIYIEGNPGESGCNKSIAEDKGWWPW
jgi:hypothetical protein